MPHDSKLARWLAAGALTLALVGCNTPEADPSMPEELGTTSGSLTNSRPWTDAPLFVKQSLVYFKHGTNGTATCSGTLISNTKVVTARHCVNSSNPTSHKVVFDNNVEQTVWAIKTHPSADLAVMTINGIPAGSAQAPMKIHTPGSLVAGNRVIIAGAGRTSYGLKDERTRRWGKTVFREPLATYGSFVGTNYVEYVNGLRFTPDVPCTGTDPACSNGCPGDSGGPMYQYRGTEGWGLIGVHSTATCDDPDPELLRTITADARAYRDWILN
jgi:hypothetical protein